MSGKQKIYDKLISGNASVQNRYFSFVSSHSRLHGVMPAAAWGNALLLYIKYSVFHFPDRKFGEYSLSAEETAGLLCKADVVSFDIFDTLIFRSVSQKEVFDNTGRTLGIENFGKIRADSENEARKEKKEPCINDIYRIIAVKAGLTDKAAEEAVKAECNEEFSVCRADPFMLDVYGRVISCGKTVIITTDMYLTESVISKLLCDNGFSGYEKLFVSCKYGCGKSDGGLYRIIKNEYGGKRIVHMGDNYMSDVLTAGKAGFEAVYYRRKA